KISGEVLLQLELTDTASTSLNAEAISAKWHAWLSAVLGTPLTDIQDPLNKGSDGAEQEDDDEEDDDDESSDEVADSTEQVGVKKDLKQETKKKKRRLPRRKQT